MKEYRKDYQFTEIMVSLQYGNVTQAVKECLRYGFYAQDLADNLSRMNPVEDIENLNNLCAYMRELLVVIEEVTKIRCNNESDH